ncbi:MAG: hypothetical protein ACI4Q4_06330, partial [Oscillospiraceae bacterium]
MKNTKRITAAALALSSLMALTACEEEAPENSTATSAPPVTTAATTKATMNEEDAAAVAEIDIGAEKLENPKVRFLSSWDLNPAEGQPLSVALEMFQTQYGGEIVFEFTPWDDRYTKLATLV